MSINAELEMILNLSSPILNLFLQYPFRSAPAPAPAPTPAPAPAQPIAPVAREIPALPQPDPREASVEGIFGIAGANNVRLDAPEFSFAYDLRK